MKVYTARIQTERCLIPSASHDSWYIIPIGIGPGSPKKTILALFIHTHLDLS